MISRMISIGRDNIVRMSSEQEFYEKNPAFLAIRDELAACRKAFNDSGRKAGCHCRADTKLLVPCIDAFLAILLNAQNDKNSYDIVNSFVRYVAKTEDIQNTGVSIYFRDLAGGDEMRRYEFYELHQPE